MPTAKCEARRRENGTKNITFIYVYAIRRIFRRSTPCMAHTRYARVCWNRVWSRRNAEPQADTEYCSDQWNDLYANRWERSRGEPEIDCVVRTTWFCRFGKKRRTAKGEGMNPTRVCVAEEKINRRKMCGWWAYALFIFRAHLMGNFSFGFCSFARLQHTHQAGQHKIAIILHLSTVFFRRLFQLEIYFNLCRIFDVFRFHSQKLHEIYGPTCDGMRWRRTYPCRTYESQTVSNDTHTQIAETWLFVRRFHIFSCGWLIFAWIRFDCGASMAQPTLAGLESCVQYPAACSIVPQNDVVHKRWRWHDSISLITQPHTHTHSPLTDTHCTRNTMFDASTRDTKMTCDQTENIQKHWNATSQTFSVRVPFV